MTRNDFYMKLAEKESLLSLIPYSRNIDEILQLINEAEVDENVVVKVAFLKDEEDILRIRLFGVNEETALFLKKKSKKKPFECRTKGLKEDESLYRITFICGK